MSNIKNLCLISASAMILASVVSASGIDNGEISIFLNDNSHIHSHTYNEEGLKPIPKGSYQTAALFFLPDLDDSEMGFGGRDLNTDHSSIENCKDYTLKKCPEKGICNRCPFGESYFLSGCTDGFGKSGNSCVPSSCQAINSVYLSEIPTNKICSKSTEYGLTCYLGCTNIACQGYNANCDTVYGQPNVNGVEVCPNCSDNSTSNCSPKLCKVTTCSNNKKTNADATACIDKDDTCPTSYYKSCPETGIETTVTPQTTELGTKCYKCKPKEQPWEACAKRLKTTYPSFTAITSSSYPSSSGGPYVIVKDISLPKLPGEAIFGAKYFTSIPECAKLDPTLTIEYTAPADIADYTSITLNTFSYIQISDLNIDYKVNNSTEKYITVYGIKISSANSHNSYFKNTKFTNSTGADYKSSLGTLLSFDSGDYKNPNKNTLSFEGNVQVTPTSDSQYTQMSIYAGGDGVKLKFLPNSDVTATQISASTGQLVLDKAKLTVLYLALSYGPTIRDSKYTAIGHNPSLIATGSDVYVKYKMYMDWGAPTRWYDGSNLYAITINSSLDPEIVMNNFSTVNYWNPANNSKTLIKSAPSGQKCVMMFPGSGSTVCLNNTTMSYYSPFWKCCANSGAEFCGASSNDWYDSRGYSKINSAMYCSSW